MASKIENLECLCAWAAYLGDFRATFMALIDSAVGLLTLAKAMLALAPVNVSDQLKKVELQVELEILAVQMRLIEAPIAYALNYAKPFADCDPVANVITTINKIKYSYLSDFIERQFELELMIEALKKESLKIEWIDLAIASMNEIKSALEDCANVTT